MYILLIYRRLYMKTTKIGFVTILFLVRLITKTNKIEKNENDNYFSDINPPLFL